MATKNTIRDHIDSDKIISFQSYGSLVILDKINFNIKYYSENIFSLLNIKKHDLLNNPITQFLKTNHTPTIENFLLNSNMVYEYLLWESKRKIKVCVYIHQKNNDIILEIEPLIAADDLSTGISDINQLINLKLDSFSNDLNDQSQLCEEIKKVTGYDDVLLYQFKEDNSSIVIGEASTNSESYLGLCFPETDVPYPARQMYLNQPHRYIPDRDYPPVHLLSASNPYIPPKHDFTDVMLRGVEPIYLQYLKNMDSSSVASFAIISENCLWGLITLHNQTPKLLTVACRLGLLFLTKAISAELAVIEKAHDNDSKDLIITMQNEIREKTKSAVDFVSAFKSITSYLVSAFSADGVVLCYDNTFLTYGSIPKKSDLSNITSWLFERPNKEIFFTRELSQVFPNKKYAFNKSPGMLSINLTKNQKNYLLFFRKERIENLLWAGNPNEALVQPASGHSPRTSFKAWLEIVSNKSLAWDNATINSAKSLQAILSMKQLEFLLRTQAHKDPLTDLYNRRTLLEQLTKEISRAQRSQKKLAILMLDIDFFKTINDQYGHTAGDEVLIKISALLKGCIRHYDYIYRYGGEEFLLIFSEVTEHTVMKRTEEILNKVRHLKIKYEHQFLSKITTSIGVSLYPNNSEDPNGLIKLADNALYEAKNRGRDQAVFSSATNYAYQSTCLEHS